MALLSGIPHLERPDGQCAGATIYEHVLQLPAKVARVAAERVPPTGRAGQLRPAPNEDERSTRRTDDHGTHPHFREYKLTELNPHDSVNI